MTIKYNYNHLSNKLTNVQAIARANAETRVNGANKLPQSNYDCSASLYGLLRKRAKTSTGTEKENTNKLKGPPDPPPPPPPGFSFLPLSSPAKKAFLNKKDNSGQFASGRLYDAGEAT